MKGCSLHFRYRYCIRVASERPGSTQKAWCTSARRVARQAPRRGLRWPGPMASIPWQRSLLRIRLGSAPTSPGHRWERLPPILTGDLLVTVLAQHFHQECTRHRALPQSVDLHHTLVPQQHASHAFHNRFEWSHLRNTMHRHAHHGCSERVLGMQMSRS